MQCMTCFLTYQFLPRTRYGLPCCRMCAEAEVVSHLEEPDVAHVQAMAASLCNEPPGIETDLGDDRLIAERLLKAGHRPTIVGRLADFAREKARRIRADMMMDTYR